MFETVLRCTKCGREYSLVSGVYKCRECGAPLDVQYDYEGIRELIDSFKSKKDCELK